METVSARSRGLLLVAITGTLLWGCGREQEQVTRGAPPATETTREQPGAMPPSPAAVSDANIAALINEVNVADSSLAALAMPKLTDSDVKAFAQQMMTQHHQLNVEGMQAAAQANITPQLPSPDPFKSAVDAEQSALRSMQAGPAYDSMYIANEIAVHQAVINWLNEPGHQPQNPVYQQYLRSAGPVLQQHLDRAVALQNKLKGTSGTGM